MRTVEFEAKDRRSLIDHYPTETALYAKQLYADAKIAMLTTSYEDEDGYVRVFLPAGVEDREIDNLEEKLAEKSTEILQTTGLSILVGVFGRD